MKKLNKSFWEHRYRENKTGWDVGHVSLPIKTYIDQLTNKDLKILIPGAGNSYEAEYLWKKGFKNVFVLDIANQPLINLKKRLTDFPNEQLINKDFFELKDSFDLIIEQTFFCALQPNLRKNYSNKMNELLEENGKLVGLLFNFELTKEGPPFGGSKTEYLNLFSSVFKINTLEKSYNSIKPREHKEQFFIFEKNNH
ncbi:TPMT family class I SAM-dependent methyltransferase [Flavobacteriaceae bacterium S0825]|uniref:methyltransferase domain-containing protein n=1 Tax=Gaetbulibacter sp. S0825 TaxID=2720084 RepID=UPI0014322A25|nr:methyltransferase domain-containing protein [Gaetbulibacter sp. S0825]MCK0109112.1 TPMT family class I SAM-dependent methyltransferase [Flavobacteriaceae bacterium S0825]NIX64747.1 SAM-dependent methyltransferase [Gaetbulibacter sp. S0825]